MQNIDLNTFANGAIQEKFNEALEKVLENMLDPNTSFKNKRGITIDIGFTQNENRDDASVSISVKTKTASPVPVETSVAMGKNLKTGSIEVQEYGKQIKGQMSFRETEEEMERVVDKSTGEIYETPVNNVVDLRSSR